MAVSASPLGAILAWDLADGLDLSYAARDTENGAARTSPVCLTATSRLLCRGHAARGAVPGLFARGSGSKGPGGPD
jgi:hypothetical protein